MKAITYLLLIAVLFSSCGKFGNDNDLVTARWVFAKTDAQDIKKLAAETEYNYGTDGFKEVFAASKFIIRPDNTFDLNLFQNYRHGKWEHKDRFLILRTEPFNDSLYFTVDTVAYSFMQLRLDSINFRRLGRFVRPDNISSLFGSNDEIRFMLKLDNERYKDEDKDPYSKSNNQWRIKPVRSETAEEIKERVLNLIDFHILMFEDAWDRNKETVLYNWFSSPLIVANNGIALRKYEDIQADWEDHFFNQQQAMQGYSLLKSGFKKKIKQDENIERRFLRNKDLLKQFRKNLE